jgi:hypothetical protein
MIVGNERGREELRDEYLSRVDTLFQQAKAWATQCDADATFSEEEIDIREEPVGQYRAPVLVISRPNRKRIRLIPRGCWILGAQGRVDMKSDLGTETLVYVLEAGPSIRFDIMTENGEILEEGRSHSFFKDVTPGWALIQNRQLGMLPTLDGALFARLLEVLGQ